MPSEGGNLGNAPADLLRRHRAGTEGPGESKHVGLDPRITGSVFWQADGGVWTFESDQVATDDSLDLRHEAIGVLCAPPSADAQDLVEDIQEWLRLLDGFHECGDALLVLSTGCFQRILPLATLDPRNREPQAQVYRRVTDARTPCVQLVPLFGLLFHSDVDSGRENIELFRQALRRPSVAQGNRPGAGASNAGERGVPVVARAGTASAGPDDRERGRSIATSLRFAAALP